MSTHWNILHLFVCFFLKVLELRILEHIVHYKTREQEKTKKYSLYVIQISCLFVYCCTTNRAKTQWPKMIGLFYFNFFFLFMTQAALLLVVLTHSHVCSQLAADHTHLVRPSHVWGSAGFSWQNLSLLHVVSLSSTLVWICFNGRIKLPSETYSWHPVTSITLHWPKQVREPGQIQGIG